MRREPPFFDTASNEGDPFLCDFILVLEVGHQQRFEHFVFAHDFGAFRRFVVEGLALRGIWACCWALRSTV